MVEKQRSRHHEHEDELKTGARPTPGQATRGARPRLGQATRGAAIRQRSEHHSDEEELQARARPRRGQATIGARPQTGSGHTCRSEESKNVPLKSVSNPPEAISAQRTDGGVEIVTLQRKHTRSDGATDTGSRKKPFELFTPGKQPRVP